HTIVNSQGKFALHLVPAGIFNPSTLCVIGPGVALNPTALMAELDELDSRGVKTGNLRISDRTHLILPYHVLLDNLEEEKRGNGGLGTTGRGIGPSYVDKVSRRGIRAGDLLDPERFRAKVERGAALLEPVLSTAGLTLSVDSICSEYLAIADRLRGQIGEVSLAVQDAIDADQTILIEGAQGSLLDLDHGTYPYVTSSSPTVAGLCLGAGIGPRHLTQALGVFKAYSTRVGSGPMPTELHDEIGSFLREQGHEYGTTTGRPRRCGWFDAVVGRHSAIVNGFDGIVLTRLDILDNLDELKVCVAYELDGQRIQHMPSSVEDLDRCLPLYETLPGWTQPVAHVREWDQLPGEAQSYVKRLESLMRVPITHVGIGESREDMIVLNADGE
ncbi:MAG TPA: adenylosuccinate synthase, partial [Chloroflexota bacterium]|nr:adenylosuccinate synthase [Chloroflexota bacterium]